MMYIIEFAKRGINQDAGYGGYDSVDIATYEFLMAGEEYGLPSVQISKRFPTFGRLAKVQFTECRFCKSYWKFKLLFMNEVFDRPGASQRPPRTAYDAA